MSEHEERTEPRRQAGATGATHKINFEVDAEVYGLLVAAGSGLNGQRPNQVARLLVTKRNIEALEQQWARMFGSNGQG